MTTEQLSCMLTAREQQELRQIEKDLRADRGFTRRLTVLQSALCWAAPGRRAYLPVLVAALLWLAAAAGRLLMGFAEGGALLGPGALMTPGDTAWPG